MKLWHSFLKELLLSSRTFYFYIELVAAGMFLFLLLFVIPENFNTKTDEYVYWDIPEAARPLMVEEALELDEDGVSEQVEFELDERVVAATLYEGEDERVYVFENEEDAIRLAEQEREFAGVIHMSDAGEITYTYYLQGYETERLRNIYLVLHNEDFDTLEAAFNAQEVRTLESGTDPLSDRENIIPSFLTFNGSLMGLFIIASYIFLDKKEGVIKAYAGACIGD